MPRSAQDEDFEDPDEIPFEAPVSEKPSTTRARTGRSPAFRVTDAKASPLKRVPQGVAEAAVLETIRDLLAPAWKSKVKVVLTEASAAGRRLMRRFIEEKRIFNVRQALKAPFAVKPDKAPPVPEIWQARTTFVPLERSEVFTCTTCDGRGGTCKECDGLGTYVYLKHHRWVYETQQRELRQGFDVDAFVYDEEEYWALTARHTMHGRESLRDCSDFYGVERELDRCASTWTKPDYGIVLKQDQADYYVPVWKVRCAPDLYDETNVVRAIVVGSPRKWFVHVEPVPPHMAAAGKKR